MGLLDDLDSVAYCVDIAMLIDATGGMGHIINEVKANALDFCKKFHEAMEENGKNVDELRIKVIPFRDYQFDGAKAMDDSGFFSLPEQNEAFESYVKDIVAEGGGDEPENALEAMSLAMRSDWTTKGSKRRHVILVFTDAPAVPLRDEKRVASPYYPPNMPADLKELEEMWDGRKQGDGMPEYRSARLVVFAPNVEPWTSIQAWNYAWVAFSKYAGLHDIDIDMAIRLLVGNIVI